MTVTMNFFFYFYIFKSLSLITPQLKFVTYKTFHQWCKLLIMGGGGVNGIRMNAVSSNTSFTTYSIAWHLNINNSIEISYIAYDLIEFYSLFHSIQYNFNPVLNDLNLNKRSFCILVVKFCFLSFYFKMFKTLPKFDSIQYIIAYHAITLNPFFFS